MLGTGCLVYTTQSVPRNYIPRLPTEAVGGNIQGGPGQALAAVAFCRIVDPEEEMMAIVTVLHTSHDVYPLNRSNLG